MPSAVLVLLLRFGCSRTWSKSSTSKSVWGKCQRLLFKKTPNHDTKIRLGIGKADQATWGHPDTARKGKRESRASPSPERQTSWKPTGKKKTFTYAKNGIYEKPRCKYAYIQVTVICKPTDDSSGNAKPKCQCQGHRCGKIKKKFKLHLTLYPVVLSTCPLLSPTVWNGKNPSVRPPSRNPCLHSIKLQRLKNKTRQASIHVRI